MLKFIQSHIQSLSLSTIWNIYCFITFAIKRISPGIIAACLLILTLHSLKADDDQEKAPPLSADVSYVIVDMKLNSQRGAQICEIQHGISSAFKGDAFHNNGKSVIAQNLLKELGAFYQKSWASYLSVADLSTKQLLHEDPHWSLVGSLNELETLKEFQLNATLPVLDPSDLSSYHGFALISPKEKNRESFQKKYPGIVLIDNAFNTYANNKYRMTQALMGNPITEQHKPKWQLYNRNDPDLVARINSEIGSDMLVMKPLNKYLGEGVIILRKEELLPVFEYLFEKSNSTLLSTDPAYNFWRKSKTTKFIVEEFIESDPIAVPHLDGKLYCPTLRLVFLLFYNKNTIKISCLGGYYSLPIKALNEEGSLNEQYKSCCRVPYYAKVDLDIKAQAEAQIKEVLYNVYEKLLGIK